DPPQHILKTQPGKAPSPSLSQTHIHTLISLSPYILLSFKSPEFQNSPNSIYKNNSLFKLFPLPPKFPLISYSSSSSSLDLILLILIFSIIKP
ncbi:hypothetical protein CFP56_027254, partial [Quercus suber]